jgi:TPR repeat protein
MYANGRGVPQDAVEAVKWYRMAAAQGVAMAQFGLGIMYATGRGVPQNDTQAYAWLSIAAAQGSERAEKGMMLVAESMTRKERARAQKLSREYWEAYVLPFRN